MLDVENAHLEFEIYFHKRNWAKKILSTWKVDSSLAIKYKSILYFDAITSLNFH